MTELEMAKIIDANTAAGWEIPAIPTAADWSKLAHLRLRKRLNPHGRYSGAEESFQSALEAVGRHPAFAAQAEAATLACERQFRSVEVAAMESELASIDADAWGLSKAEQAAALIIGGMKPAATGPGIPQFDHARERAALELTTGSISLDGFLTDLRRAAELKQQIAAAKTELKSLTTTAEREAAARAERVKAARAERAALRKREAVGV